MEWVTGKQNKEHAWNNGLCKRKIPLEYYLFIYCLNKLARILQRDIAEYYKVNVTAIQRVIKEVRDVYTQIQLEFYFTSRYFQEKLQQYRGFCPELESCGWTEKQPEKYTTILAEYRNKL